MCRAVMHTCYKQILRQLDASLVGTNQQVHLPVIRKMVQSPQVLFVSLP